MSDEGAGRAIPREELAAMLRVVRPDWELQAATLASTGWTSLYHLDVETDAGSRACVLKTSPDDDESGGVATEFRIQALVDEHTAMPVPTVLGAVDSHDALRTPYFLMESLPGEHVPWEDVGALHDATLQRIAGTLGRALSQLHELDVELDGFGAVVLDERSAPLYGGGPSSDPARLGVSTRFDRWAAQLREWFEEDLRTLAASRFGDLAPALRAEQARRLAALPERFRPVLEQADLHWENVLIDRAAGTLAGVLDWGQAHAVAPAFSLAFVEHSLAGRRGIALTDVPDRRPLVREALMAGYRDETSVPPKLDAQRACYGLNLLVLDMAHFEERTGSSDAVIPEDRIEDAAAGYRAAAAAELGRDAG